MLSPEAYDRLTDGLRAADAILAKAVNIGELAQIARIETTLRQYLTVQWRKFATRAVARAGANPANAPKLVRDTMSGWAPLVSRRVAADLEQIYRLARIVAWKKAQGHIRSKLTYNSPVLKAAGKGSITPKFDASDDKAIESIQDNTLFWIGDHYDRNVSDGIATVARQTMLEAGNDRAAAGKQMRAVVESALEDVTVPDGFHGAVDDYFSGLVANATTVARNYGQMRSFGQAEVETYVITNPGDERECDRCDAMDGKTFPVQAGINQMQSEMDMDEPEDIQDAHPWPSLGDILGIRSSAGFIKRGMHMPPFHFHCRCTVDVA